MSCANRYLVVPHVRTQVKLRTKDAAQICFQFRKSVGTQDPLVKVELNLTLPLQSRAI